MNMRRWLWIISAASLLLYPFAAGAADYGSSITPSTESTPPVAQTLVREGDFAVKLAAVLDIGTPASEAAAEDLLVQMDIAPVNGWISDYPMTPQIVGQLQESISRSASEGKLPMTSDHAVKGLYAVTAQFNLPTPAGQAAASGGNAPSAVPPDQQAINDYYYDVGPPVVTYYPPPYYYGYLYDWVPYPVWWIGFWFPGFYICHNFTTVVVFQSRTVVVSNHFVDHHTGRVVTVAQGGRLGGGQGRMPGTVLRTEQGERFMTVADMQRGIRVAGPSGEAQQRGDRAVVGSDRQWTPEARRSAGLIYSRSMRAPLPERGELGTDSRNRGNAVPRATGERNWSTPSHQRYASPPMTMRRENEGWARQYAPPQGTFRNEPLSSPTNQRGALSGAGRRQVYDGRRAPFSGESWQGRGQWGGGFSGGACRGRC